MAQNMVASLAKYLAENPARINEAGERGYTMLHREALAGNANVVAVLLQHGADANATTSDGKTPLALAQVFAWPRVIERLTATRPGSP
jgi:ankyrin repeat protein